VASLREVVLRNTVLARPWLVPELELRLVTHESRLWTALDGELAALGMPMPYWAFAWPGGQALARHLLDHPELVRGRRVLDFGCGGAVEGVAALKAGAASVLCADLDPLAVEAAALNARHAGFAVETTTAELVGTHGPWEVVLCGDVTYEPELAMRVLRWLHDLAAAGTVALLADPGRVPFPREGLEVLGEYDAPHDGDVRGTTLWKTQVLRVAPPENR